MLYRVFLSIFVLIVTFSHIGMLHAQSTDFDKLQNKIIELQKSQSFEQAIIQSKSLLEQSKQKFGEQSKEYATALNLLGSSMFYDGQLSDAEPYLKKALEIDEKLLAPNHPNLARDLKILANLYYSLVRFEQADRLMARANKIAKK